MKKQKGVLHYASEFYLGGIYFLGEERAQYCEERLLAAQSAHDAEEYEYILLKMQSVIDSCYEWGLPILGKCLTNILGKNDQMVIFNVARHWRNNCN